jgi:hypothetical protein
MVKTFEQQEISNVTVGQLALNPGDLSGDLISGGVIKKFNSTGIQDNASGTTLIVEDGKIIVEAIKVRTIDSDLTIRGDVKIYGVLDAGQIRTTEIIANQRYEKQFLEFANPQGNPAGTGFIWSGGAYNKQFVFHANPDRFFATENIDLLGGRSFMIDGQTVIDSNSIGKAITDSQLRTVGTLRSLTVGGKVNFGDVVHFNPASERFSIGTDDANGLLTVYDNVHDVELIVSTNHDSQGVIGTYSTKDLTLVTDNQTRITIESTGNITLGTEGRDSTVTRIYGRVGIGVKNPREYLEVAGNIRWANKLFAIGDQPPLDGSYQQGDIVWNSNPIAQAYIGWVCVVGGNPGLWKPFGAIAE